MTFDDGILKIYQVKNVSEAGAMPRQKLVKAGTYHYGSDTVYYKRYYTAKQAGYQADTMVHIWYAPEIESLDIVVLEDGDQYKIAQVQHGKEEGLRVTWLTLERLMEDYEYAGDA